VLFYVLFVCKCVLYYCHRVSTQLQFTYLYISYHIIPYIIYLFYLYYLIFINEYMVLFLFNNVIYVFLLLWLCILIVCLCKTTLTEGFPCSFLSCKANARVKTRKDGARPALFQIFVLFYVLFVLCRSLYCLFCVVLCIVCVYMCTVLLPPGGYPIAVNKYIISYHFYNWIHSLYFTSQYIIVTMSRISRIFWDVNCI